MFHRRRVISTTAANERITKTLLRSNGLIEAIKRVDRLLSLSLSLSLCSSSIKRSLIGKKKNRARTTTKVQRDSIGR